MPRHRRAQELSSGALLAFALLFVLALSGCKKKELPPGKSGVDAVHVENLPRDADKAFQDGLATRKTETFAGLHVFEYEVYDPLAVEKDIQRIERELRRRGYYEARVSAARVVRVKERMVRVEFRVEPGEPVTIRTLETEGLAALPFDAAEAATHEIRLRVGSVFDEDDFEQAKNDVANSLADRGYAYAEVQGTAKVDLANKTAQVKFHVKPGRPAKLGEITIEGLHKIEERPVRRTLQLRSGQKYSRRQLQDARTALFSLGVFSRVEVLPQLDDPNREAVPVTIRVQESTLRDISVSAGARLDLLRLAFVSQAGWTHRNFLGGLRKLSITSKPGLTFFATRFDYLKPPIKVFPENYLTARIVQPGLFEGRTRGYFQSGYNVYPLLYPLSKEEEPREVRVIGYHELTNAVGLERNFWGRLLGLGLSLNWQANFPFIYQGVVPGETVEEAHEGLGPVIVTFPELLTEIDLRDDPVQPTTGFHFTNSFQTAVPILGSDVLDVRIKPQIGTYVPLDSKHKLVLATRVGLGFLLADNYGSALRQSQGDLDYTSDEVVRAQHRLLFRAFYSGGPNSNRGYPYQRVGPQGAIGFLLPEGETCAGPDPPPVCFRPLGGFSMWEASVELRYKAFEKWSFVGFVDSSDVSYKLHHISFTEPHVSVGPGVRYLSPVGPIRFDVAFRIPGLQKLSDIAANSDEPPDISEISPYDQQQTWFTEGKWYNYFALQILIGEAF